MSSGRLKEAYNRAVDAHYCYCSKCIQHEKCNDAEAIDALVIAAQEEMRERAATEADVERKECIDEDGPDLSGQVGASSRIAAAIRALKPRTGGDDA